VAEDFPGFIVNRIPPADDQRSDYVLHEASATIESIDMAMRLRRPPSHGSPAAGRTFIGLDTCLSIMQVLYDGLADSKYRPCPLLVKVRRGRLAGAEGRARLLTTTAGRRPRPTR